MGAEYLASGGYPALAPGHAWLNRVASLGGDELVRLHRRAAAQRFKRRALADRRSSLNHTPQPGLGRFVESSQVRSQRLSRDGMV